MLEEHPAKVAPDLLVRLRPGLLAGVPDYAPEAAARVAQRHNEQPWAAVPIAAWYTCERALAVVGLGFLTGSELASVKLLGLAFYKPAGKALDAVVGAGMPAGPGACSHSTIAASVSGTGTIERTVARRRDGWT